MAVLVRCGEEEREFKDRDQARDYFFEWEYQNLKCSIEYDGGMLRKQDQHARVGSPGSSSREVPWTI